MRFLSYLTTLLIAVLLTACGGGGGSAGTTSGSAPPSLSTTAPASVILPVGSSLVYSIKGGTGPFTIRNSDMSIAVGAISGDVLTLGTVAAGSATVTVVDDKGAQVVIAVTVGSSTAFYTTAPGTLTIAPGTSQAFKLGGGSGIYSASSSNISMVSATVTGGNNLTINGLTIGSATVTILDSGKTPITIAVTVGTVPLALSPSSATAFIGDQLVAIITGGTPPYTASVGNVGTISIDNLLANNQLPSNQLVMTMQQLASPSIVTVLDANSQKIAFSATIKTGTDVIRLSPDTLTVSENDTQPITLKAYGAATTGTTRVFSSNINLLQASIAGNIVTVTRVGGCVAADTPVTITIIDSKGSIGKSTVTIQNNHGAAACP